MEDTLSGSQPYVVTHEVRLKGISVVRSTAQNAARPCNFPILIVTQWCPKATELIGVNDVVSTPAIGRMREVLLWDILAGRLQGIFFRKIFMFRRIDTRR